MKEYTLPPMRPELVVCPKPECGASGRIGVHSYTKRQYICHACKKTFAETSGTMLYDLKRPTWLVVLVLALLSHGCPVPAIVFAFGLDERTLAFWQFKAGQHARQLQQQVVCQGQLDLSQVQADELYTKTQAGPIWIATAMTVFSRLWLWGAIGIFARRGADHTGGRAGARGGKAWASDFVGRRWLCSLREGDALGLS